MPLLIAKDHDVTALARSPQAARRLQDLGAEPIGGDLDDPDTLQRALETARAEVLVNLASLGFGHAPGIVAATQRSGVTRAVFVSTTAIFTQLNAPSKQVRLTAEQEIRASELDWTIIRPTMIYGTLGDRNMARLLWLLRKSPVIPLPGRGTRLQQPVHVADLAAAVCEALLSPYSIRTAYDVAGPEPITFRQVIEQAAGATGRKPLLVPLPLAPLIGAARLYEKLASRPRFKAEQLERLAEDKAFDISAAREHLHYDPRPFDQGIREEARASIVSGSVTRSIGLYVRTVRHLRPAQVYHRARNRSHRKVMAKLSARLEPAWSEAPTGGWPEGFVPLAARYEHAYPSAEANGAHEFRFLNTTHGLGDPPDWLPADASQLWRYHLHYFDWAWSFVGESVAEAKRDFGTLWASWKQSTTFPLDDPWHPYVASLRAWNLCGIFQDLIRDGEIEDRFLETLHLHGEYLSRQLELDVGGNHLLKNLKALIGLGVFFRRDDWLDDSCSRLQRQLRVQILADGGHYERSPTYHCQVLGDLIDMAGLLESARRPRVLGIDTSIAVMRKWLGAMLMPDGDVPLFNDCTLVGRDVLELLQPDPTKQRLVVLRDSGYAVVRPDERSHIVLDFGDPCPEDLPAHAHADCLSFELAIDGKRLVVDSGTSTYEGPRRSYERSTRAHNTVEIDGADQTEVWGRFRAARRARPILESVVDQDDVLEVRASHDGYRRLEGSPIHRRTWRTRAGQLVINDEISGTGRHQARTLLHLASGMTCEPAGESTRAGPIALSLSINDAPQGLQIVRSGSEALVATDQGELFRSACLQGTIEVSLPLNLRITIEWDIDAQT